MTYVKPLLAASVEDLAALRYPLYASPKLDGVRCLVKDGRALTRALKEVPNRWLQDLVSDGRLDGLDGELVVGAPTAPGCYRATAATVLSHEGPVGDLRYHVFDKWDAAGGYFHRLQALGFQVQRCPRWVLPVPQTQVNDAAALERFEVATLVQGYEGVMLRAPFGAYKHGRSTLAEGTLLKLKRFADGEAAVLEVLELRRNENPAQLDALGYVTRGKARAGLVGAGLAGALRVRDRVSGVEFELGSGLDEATRRWWWAQRGKVARAPGELLVRYKHFPLGGKDRPRHPVYLGLRNPLDL